MKKRLFSLVLSVLMVMCVFPANVFADTDTGIDASNQYRMQFSVDKVTVGHNDETVEISINLVRNVGFAGMTYQLIYDKDVLTLEQQPVLNSDMSFEYVGGPLNEGKHTGMLSSDENVYGDGVLLTYTFKINPSVKAGTYDIALITDGVADLPGGETIALEVLDESLVPVINSSLNGSITVPGYTVAYDANGGDGAPESQTKDKNGFVYISSTFPVRSGYTFLGWSSTKTASVAEYKAGDKYSENADVTLYAVWKKQEIIAGSIDIAVSSAEGKAGDEVEIAVSVDNHLGFNGMDFDVIYDNTKLEYVSYEQKMMFGGLIEASDPDKYENKVNFQILAGTQNVVEVGELVTLKFKVLETAEDGLTEVALIPNDVFCLYGPNMSDATLTANVTNGGVEISSQLVGDINLDEIVNSDDAVLLLQHLLFGETVFPIEYKGTVDFNKDGLENSDDAVRLLQYALFGNLFPIE